LGEEPAPGEDPKAPAKRQELAAGSKDFWESGNIFLRKPESQLMILPIANSRLPIPSRVDGGADKGEMRERLRRSAHN